MAAIDDASVGVNAQREPSAASSTCVSPRATCGEGPPRLGAASGLSPPGGIGTLGKRRLKGSPGSPSADLPASLGGRFGTEEGVGVLLLELLGELIDAEDGPDPGQCTRTLTLPLTHGYFGHRLSTAWMPPDSWVFNGRNCPGPWGGHRREERECSPRLHSP